MLHLTPIDTSTPQSELAYTMAHFLARKGVDPDFALLTAIDIMLALQKALDANDMSQATKYFLEYPGWDIMEVKKEY